MKASTQGLKTLKLTPSRLAWASSVEHTISPFSVKSEGFKGKEKREDFQTLCYRMPVDALRIERVVIDGALLWERNQGSTFTSAILAGGGRWSFRRTWFARKVVGTDLLLRDFPLSRYGNQLPASVLVTYSK